jgi:uncharacterized protein YycO
VMLKNPEHDRLSKRPGRSNMCDNPTQSGKFL